MTPSNAWKEEAYRVGREMAQIRKSFTSEDIRMKMNTAIDPPDPRAMGGVMRTLQSEGLIQPSDTYIRYKKRKNHGRPQRVWWSKVYSGWGKKKI